MFEWISVNFNLPTVIVALVLIAVVVWDIRKLVNDRKKGCNSCGVSCSGCSMAGNCHSSVEIPERFRAKKPAETTEGTSMSDKR